MEAKESIDVNKEFILTSTQGEIWKKIGVENLRLQREVAEKIKSKVLDQVNFENSGEILDKLNQILDELKQMNVSLVKKEGAEESKTSESTDGLKRSAYRKKQRVSLKKKQRKSIKKGKLNR